MVNNMFFDKYNGKDVYLYFFENEYLKVGITDFGAAIQTIKLKTAKGIKDVCLGFNSVLDYLESGTYCGAIVGRVGNRIRNGKFILGGKEYSVTINDGNNHLHGGTVGFDKRFFNVAVADNTLIFSLISNDGDQGYPGELKLKVVYSLSGKSLKIKFYAKSDKDTLWNPTCHTYFNLNGEEQGDISDTELKIYADAYTPCDDEIIPTGEIKNVRGTDFDFMQSRNIGYMLSNHGGYDDNFILNGQHAASAKGVKSGIKLDVYTDLPAIQFYTGNFIKGRGKSREYFRHDGFCLEPQFVPNAINIDGVDKPILKANETKKYFITYKFGC